MLLDFYRVRNESGLTLLTALDSLHDKTICTYQVEMEFKKNRQAAIIESLGHLKRRDPVAHAAFLAESASAAILGRRIEDANRRIHKFRDRLRKVLESPTRSDPVYKVVQRLFVDDTASNLTRTKDVRRAIKRLALRRFLLGYPPRKPKDTSMGDAVNWEWIIHLAKETGRNVAIVSRDSDYGEAIDKKVYINDWLVQEFKDRVSKKRQLLLVDRLSHALKLLDVKVTKEAEQEEAEVAKRTEEKRLLWPEIGGKDWQAAYLKLFRQDWQDVQNLVVLDREERTEAMRDRYAETKGSPAQAILGQ